MTNAELTILTLIAEQPRHGYQIEQVIEERGMREWTEIGFSSIYYLTNKLQQDGLIEAGTEHAVGRGPARKVYHITQRGMVALRAAITEALSVPQPRQTSFSLATGNLPIISSAEAVAALQSYRDALTNRLAHVQDRWETQQPMPYYVNALFDYSVTMIQAEKMWVEKFIQQVEEQHEQN